MNNFSRIPFSLNDKFFCTKEEFITAVSALSSTDSPKYKDIIEDEFPVIRKMADNISISTDYNSESLPDGTLAYYRIKGVILSESDYAFSSRNFERDLLLADQNPSVSCHFLHITSGGGEAWYLDRLSETMRTLTKPVYTLVEKVCASAAYYIGCHGTLIKAVTQNDTIGSIGTMVSFIDIQPFFEKMGFKFIEEYATKSTLKNKKYNDLISGKPEQYIADELDPLQSQFETEVRNSRKQLAALPENHPVFLGETFSATKACELGLIDGIVTFPEAVQEAYILGKEWNIRNKAYSFV